jgi:hypothetical protein
MRPLPENLDGYFEIRERFPRPRWAAMRQWIEANADVDSRAAWVAFEFEWLQRLRGVLGESYLISSSEHFLFLAAVAESELERLHEFADGVYERIFRLLAGAAAQSPWGVPVIFVFPELDVFYDYISAAYPEEGLFLQTHGLLMNEECDHVALFGRSTDAVARDLAHELCHAAVRHLPLPRWLDEGLACVLGARLWNPVFVFERWIAEERLPWLREHIQDFWAGVAFATTEDELEFIRQAEKLVRHLFDEGQEFASFLAHAERRDGGDAAARLYLRRSLGEVGTEAFGPGDWQPCPELWLAGPD